MKHFSLKECVVIKVSVNRQIGFGLKSIDIFEGWTTLVEENGI